MSDKSVQIRPVAVAFCDDIRREDNGKFLIIGAYTAGMAVPAFPASLRLGLWFIFEAEESGKASVDIELRPPGNNKVGISLELTISDPIHPRQLNVLPIGGVPIVIPAAGDIEIAFRNRDGSWEILSVLNVSVQPAVIPNVVSIERAQLA